jgi:hypothetical protein
LNRRGHNHGELGRHLGIAYRPVCAARAGERMAMDPSVSDHVLGLRRLRGVPSQIAVGIAMLIPATAILAPAEWGETLDSIERARCSSRRRLNQRTS